METGRITYYTVPEVAEILKIPARTVYGLIYRGELRAVRVGRRIRIPEDALLEFRPWGYRVEATG